MGMLCGHKFVSRYNVTTVPHGCDEAMTVSETYVCDVCTRCGAIVESEYAMDENFETEADDAERLAIDAEERKTCASAAHPPTGDSW